MFESLPVVEPCSNGEVSLVWCLAGLSSVPLGLFGLHEHFQLREHAESLGEPS